MTRRAGAPGAPPAAEGAVGPPGGPGEGGGGPAAAYLVQGGDAALVGQALSSLLSELAPYGGGATAVEEYGEPGREEPAALGPVLDACRTPPFLAERRIVVLRVATSALGAAQVDELAAYLAAPLGTTVLVLVLTGPAATARLVKAVMAVGRQIEAEPATAARARAGWIDGRLRAAEVHLDAAAAAHLSEHLGEDLARLAGILASLASAYGPGARVGAGELEPFLGEAGGIAPWELTESLDKGDIPASLAALRRMLGGGQRHPLQVLAVLQRHYRAMLRLDGAAVADEAAAAALTGLHPYPARKALEQSRRLGHAAVCRAVLLLAAADADLRGRIGWPGELVTEVLVARLAQLARRPGARAVRR